MTRRGPSLFAWGTAAGAAVATGLAEWLVPAEQALGNRTALNAGWALVGLGVVVAVLLDSAKSPEARADDGPSYETDERHLRRLHAQSLLSAFTPPLAHDGNNALLEMRFQLAELGRLHERDGVTSALVQGLDGSVSSLEALIRRLRGLAHGDAAGTQQRVELASLAREVHDGVKTMLRSRACELHLDLTPGLVVAGKLDELQLVLMSMILHATYRAGDGGNLHLVLATEGARVVLSVHDDGIPPEPEELDEHMQPLVARHGDIDGLLLWAAKSYTKSNAGSLELNASTHGGLVRSMSLPLGADVAPEDVRGTDSSDSDESPTLRR